MGWRRRAGTGRCLAPCAQRPCTAAARTATAVGWPAPRGRQRRATGRPAYWRCRTATAAPAVPAGLRAEQVRGEATYRLSPTQVPAQLARPPREGAEAPYTLGRRRSGTAAASARCLRHRPAWAGRGLHPPGYLPGVPPRRGGASWVPASRRPVVVVPAAHQVHPPQLPAPASSLGPGLATHGHAHGGRAWWPGLGLGARSQKKITTKTGAHGWGRRALAPGPRPR